MYIYIYLVLGFSVMALFCSEEQVVTTYFKLHLLIAVPL